MFLNIKHSIALWAAVLTTLLSAHSVLADSMVQVRLVDPLDEPEFYCLDLMGWGDHLQLDDPVQAHTCKTRNPGDQLFTFKDASVLVGDTGRCLEVASSGTPLPGAAILARKCSDSPMQKIRLEENGHITVIDSGLCLVVGDQSTDASGPSHVWRVLAVGACDGAGAERMTWQIGL